MIERQLQFTRKINACMNSTKIPQCLILLFEISLNSFKIDSKLDHRIAMSFLCLGLTTKEKIIVRDAETINSSFPDFMNIMNKIGAKLQNVNN